MSKDSKTLKYACLSAGFASILAFLTLSSFNQMDHLPAFLKDSHTKIETISLISDSNAINVEKLCRAKKKKPKKCNTQINVGAKITILENNIPSDSLAKMTFQQTIKEKIISLVEFPLAGSLLPAGETLFPRPATVHNSFEQNQMQIGINIPDAGKSITIEIIGGMIIDNCNGKKMSGFREKAILTFEGPTNMQIQLDRLIY